VAADCPTPQSGPHAPDSLFPADPTGARFCQYFGYGWSPIEAQYRPGQKPQWRTRYQSAPMQPRVLWAKYRDPDTLLGVRFGETTRYGLIDLDAGSAYHPRNDARAFQQLIHALEPLGLNDWVPLQSSASGGLHLYYFLPQAVKSFELACAFKFALADAGIELQDGQVEIFPNVKTYDPKRVTNYNAHRLPLQAGSYLLDGYDFEPAATEVASLLDRADACARQQDPEVLAQALSDARARQRQQQRTRTAQAHRQPLSEQAQEWLDDLRTIINEGWSGPGQTNELLREIGKYVVVFEGLPPATDHAADRGDRQALIPHITERITQIATQLPGYRAHCNHQHEIHTRARHWAQSLYGYYLPYRSFPERYQSFQQLQQAGTHPPGSNPTNQQRQATTRERIQQAHSYLKQIGQLPARVRARIRAIQETAQALFGQSISPTTLNKPQHKTLWHPAHDPQSGSDRTESAATAENPKTHSSPTNCAVTHPPEPASRSAEATQSANAPAAQAHSEQSSNRYTPPPHEGVVPMPQLSCSAEQPAVPDASSRPSSVSSSSGGLDSQSRSRQSANGLGGHASSLSAAAASAEPPVGQPPVLSAGSSSPSQPAVPESSDPTPPPWEQLPPAMPPSQLPPGLVPGRRVAWRGVTFAIQAVFGRWIQLQGLGQLVPLSQLELPF